MNLHCHSHFSVLDGLSKPTDIARACSKRNFEFCALTDHETLAGSVSFIKACKETCECGENKKKHLASKGACAKTGCKEFKQKKIKPILGCELYICDGDSKEKSPENRKLSHLCVLAKNLEGWKELIKIVSFSNNPDRFYYHARVSMKDLASLNKTKNLIAFSGHPGSNLANVMFADIKAAYSANSYDAAKSLVYPDWEKRMMDCISLHQDIFGKENFFGEKQLIDAKNIFAAEILSKAIDYLGKKHAFRCIGTGDAHYAEKEDARDQRILLASSLKTTLSNVDKKIVSGDDVVLGGFFKSNNYHIPTLTELEALYTKEDLDNVRLVGEMCESYDISSEPKIPSFSCPNGEAPIDYLRGLCREGWKEWGIPKERYEEYGNRVKYELGVIDKAGLSTYFLIVQDFCVWAKAQGMLMSPGRGSAAGCLVAGLVGICDQSVDPVKHGLFFDRFYNSGRIVPGKVSLPDIDCDFPVYGRELVIAYIKEKYGKDKVTQISTFGRMQGRGALKDVLRAHGVCSFAQMDVISKNLPQESSIAGDLQEMVEETGESSIIRWSLENTPKLLKEWVTLKEDGTLEGEYAQYFAQAIRLEGTKKNRGKHAAGIIISSEEVAGICPMAYDSKTKELIAGMEMSDLEYLGLVKFDCLGVNSLDKVMGVEEILWSGDITEKVLVVEDEEEDD